MNFAIVGCGFIAKKHAKAIDSIEGARLVAVSDKLEEAMEHYVNHYEVTPYQELDKMLKRSDIDVVCICTPTGLHAPIATQVAKSGKHIILEKPIAMTLKDADSIIDVCEKNQVKLAVLHPNRYRPVVRSLKKILDENLLGKISHANAIVNWNRNQGYYDQSTWRGTKDHDGGALMNQGIHNLDLLLWFMGRPAEVFSMEATRLRDIEAEDVSMGTIKFDSGALGLVETSTSVYERNFEESITLFGEKGTVKIGGTNALYFEHLNIQEKNEEWIQAQIEEVAKDPWGKMGHEWIIEDMIEAIVEDRLPSINGHEARKPLELVLSMYESAENKQVITLKKEHDYAN